MRPNSKIGITAFAMSLLLWSCAREAGSTAAKAGDLDVQLAIDPDPPGTGENRLIATLKDAAGKPIDGAQLGFVYDMPAMGAMPEMKGGGDVRVEGPGRYVVTYRLSMQGDWYLTLAIDAPGHAHQEVRLKISPPRKGFTLGSQDGGRGRTIDVPPERQQLIGVAWAQVERRPLTVTLRAAGRVDLDERDVADITLKYEAYVERLFVAETGKSVKRGDPLLALYSPDLLAAEEELLQARRAGAAPDLGAAATRRLAYWGVTPEQIEALQKSGTADGRLTVASPATGVVLEKGIVEGTHLMPGMSLYRVGNLGRIWVQASVYERDGPLILLGQRAKVTLPALPGVTLDARVTFVAPRVDPKTRTVDARLELLNPNLTLKPGMFADVVVEAPLGTRLAVPDSALLLSGGHRYAFVDRGEGKIAPIEVEIGAQAGDFAEVVSGLSAGEKVATGATFLLSSEAKLRDALPRWGHP
jgi:Cu(I)/Ag(I) efflux system membrane fusion protein